MVEAEKVIVRIIRQSDDVPYTEYLPPTTSTENGGSPNERYIEVSTNERYRIEVRIRRGFKFFRQPQLRVKYFLDNTPYHDILSRCTPSGSSSEDVSSRFCREDTFDFIDRTINGELMECALAFGMLESDEDFSLGDKEVAQAVDEAGRIVVIIRRGKFGGKLQESDEPRAFDPPDDVDDTRSCKEVIYKHNVSHVTTHVPLRPAPEVLPPRPGAYRREFIRADGLEGKPIVFTFRYRSRAALVALGIKDNVDDAPSASGTANSAGVNRNSAGRTPSADFTSMLGTFQVSLSSRSDVADESDDSSDEEDMEEDDGSDATHGEEGEEGGDSGNGNDPILVSDGEQGDSDGVSDNRDDPIVLTGGMPPQQMPNNGMNQLSAPRMQQSLSPNAHRQQPHMTTPNPQRPAQIQQPPEQEIEETAQRMMATLSEEKRATLRNHVIRFMTEQQCRQALEAKKDPLVKYLRVIARRQAAQAAGGQQQLDMQISKRQDEIFDFIIEQLQQHAKLANALKLQASGNKVVPASNNPNNRFDGHNHRRQEKETTAATPTPTPTKDEEEFRSSLKNGNSVEQQEAAAQNADGSHPDQINERYMDQRRQEAEAHAEIRRRESDCMTREEEPDQAGAMTAVKRKIQNDQMEDLPAAKRNLKISSEVTDV